MIPLRDNVVEKARIHIMMRMEWRRGRELRIPLKYLKDILNVEDTFHADATPSLLNNKLQEKSELGPFPWIDGNFLYPNILRHSCFLDILFPTKSSLSLFPLEWLPNWHISDHHVDEGEKKRTFTFSSHRVESLVEQSKMSQSFLPQMVSITPLTSVASLTMSHVHTHRHHIRTMGILCEGNQYPLSLLGGNGERK